MADRNKVRVYVQFDLELSHILQPLPEAIRTVENMLRNIPNAERAPVIFGATLMPNETVVLPSDTNQVIKVRERG